MHSCARRDEQRAEHNSNVIFTTSSNDESTQRTKRKEEPDKSDIKNHRLSAPLPIKYLYPEVS